MPLLPPRVCACGGGREARARGARRRARAGPRRQVPGPRSPPGRPSKRGCALPPYPAPPPRRACTRRAVLFHHRRRHRVSDSFFFFTTKIVFLYVCFLLTLGLAQRRASSDKEGRFWWVCSPKWPRIWHHHCRFPVSLCKMYRVEMQQLVPEVKAFSMGESHGFQT